MKKTSFFTFALVAVATGMACHAFAQTITLESLLDEMVDRSKLASFPSPGYTCHQASSYNPGSVAPDKPGWFANADRSFFVRSEENQGRKEWVMMDAEGPGAIVRWWMTHKNNTGTIRIYIDGAAEPVIEGKIDELIGGTALVGPPLSGVRGRGSNLYLPIPYAKRCKVTIDCPNFYESEDGKDIVYYQINYRTYAAGTKVKSFTGSTLADAKKKIEAIQRQLLDPGSVMPRPLLQQIDKSGVCRPGETVKLPDFKGTGAICKISIKLEAKNLPQAARSIVLKAVFDETQTIWCPVGDFFGSGVGINPYKGWYRQIDKNGKMTCWWIMPYREFCSLSAENVGKEPVTISASVTTCPWTWTGRSMYFHTTWRQERNLKTKGNARKTANAFDWNFVKVKGKGVFVGDTLAVFKDCKRWWGEGDEKIFVDGEKFPSHFGTGTEDYYGYAWGNQSFFESPFHAQPRSETVEGHKGNTTNTRVRLLDAIPFGKSYKMDMEVWTWQPTTIDYAATTYWYGRPGAKANYAGQPKEAAKAVQYHYPKPEKKTKEKK